jgi:carboxylesterase type B
MLGGNSGERMIRHLLTIGLIAASVLDAGAQTPPAPGDSPVVQLQQGRIAGSGGEVLAFKGIPYALPPIGDRRWRPPQDPVAWEGTRDGTQFGPACMQAGTRRMSEDCLFLNVWTPRAAIASRDKLPVMVWVYGGSFHGGSGDIDATPVAAHGAVVVSMNYRVSTLGFMAHPELSAESPDKVSGNYGILDIAQALKWVNANIASFGGDASRITVWAQSSGASAVTALMSSPRSRGLFQRVILESPGSFRRWKTLADAEQQGLAVGASLAALRATPADRLPVIRNTGGGAAIRALAETRVIGPVLDGVVLPADERTTFESGRMARVGALVGNNTDEGTRFTGKYPVATVAAYRRYLQEPIIFGQFGAEAFSRYPVARDTDVPRAIAMSFGDSQFWYGTRGVARALAKQGQPVWRYEFTRKSDGGAGADPLHGSELAYVFGSPKPHAPPFTPDDARLSETMMTAWVRFAATGNPNGGEIQAWPPYDLETEPVMVLDVPTSIVRRPRNAELDFIQRVDDALRSR